MKQDHFPNHRRILINGIHHLCEVTHTDNIEHWSVADAEDVSEELIKNGVDVLSIDCSKLPNKIEVDRAVYHFLHETFTLNQCETDLLNWFRDSKVGEFTYYYQNVVFHRADGCYAAYRNDISNYIRI